MTILQRKEVQIFCDGACSGNPGPGGWAAILRSPNGKVKELGGSVALTTNNRMEMMALIKALKALKTKTPVAVYSDSVYVIRGATQWIYGWRSRDWKTADGQAVLNKDLWQELEVLLHQREFSWHYVRGHSGVPANERCDEIAVQFSQGEVPYLFEGPIEEYSVNLDSLPVDTTLPPMKSGSGSPKKPYSYLSYVGGVAKRHKDWSSCEAQVKGRSGARFKKAMSAAEEEQILAEWGLSSEDVKSN